MVLAFSYNYRNSLPEELQSTPSTPSKNIQLQKSPNSKPSSLSLGGESPRSFAGKKSKNALSFRDQPQVYQIPEEGKRLSRI